ncbi:LytR family transcriptional regulator [Anaerocolumna sedimenticola]|uniref:LytR family transcriptional regulator n=1 Tax=Anaerocolumna sedimenticola TaxID=2696063 RepID=A0A6P1TIF9_9FIRM|nr:LCP family protein [Anaerocolumna sedimenticola]QHQ59706.1 LytR family transcriptional regulator [Anaerocolumna sedimenticola]
MNRKKKKRRLKRKVLLFIDLMLLLIVIGFGYFIYITGKTQLDTSGDESIVTNSIDSEEIGGYRNIAIFGVDSRDNALEKSTHSDTIVIASINRKTKDIKLASIYRDTYADIPGEGFDKINAAYFKGGYPMALNTINTNFDLDVKEYLTVNFNAVCKVIDLLGGITLDITDEELKYVNGYTKELNKINGTNVGKLESAGTQLVNGTHATAYARIRYTAGGDFKRAERQRLVIQKIFEKAKKADIITINSIVNEIFPQIYTNLDSMDMLGLAKDILSYNIVDETGFPFENVAEYYNKISYVFPVDLAANVTKLHQFLFEDEAYVPSNKVQETSAKILEITGKK